MCQAPPLAGQVQGHGRERRPRVSVPDGFIAPAGPRRAQGAGTPTKERAGVLHELLCDAGWGVSVSACTWWGGGWGRSGQPAGRGPFAPGAIGSWFR